MYFKRIEMQGFKSFADPVTIELNDGITCIVGPNGSGKSNISDALRWVLGEQSPKQLRGSKMDEVIFAGTATRKAKGMAEVSLVIDNSTGILPLEYSEVAVTRRMYRSGESEYLINGNNCRLKDIKELFMDTGIGVDGYSIIGQGKIQDIVGTKPENRREIFEESAGIVMYKNRKADAERKLATASDNLERVRDILAEIESRIGTLKVESEKATEYIALRDRYKTLEVNIILHDIEGLERNLRSSEADLAELNQKYQEAASDSERLEALLESKRIEEASLNESVETSNKELLDKIEELHLIANRGQVNNERLNSLEKDLKRLDEVLQETEQKLSVARNNRTELEGGESELRAAKEEAQKALNEAVSRLNDHSRKGGIVREEIERSKDEIIERNNKNVSLQAEITTLDNYKNTLQSRSEQIRAESEGRDESDAQNRARLDEIQVAFTEKKATQSEIESTLHEVESKILSVNSWNSDCSKQMEELIIRGNRAMARKSTIEEMENNYEGYNNAVRAIMQKSFRGILGTISDHMIVPDGFELAIETALGGAMQNIICDNDQSAKAAVEWLKSARAGRATFLPISSIHANRSNVDRDIEQMDGYIGVAADRITTDARFEEIYRYLLGRVLLVDNMDHAIRISKRIRNGFRIVTLEGEVIASSGSITGGRYRNQTANLLVRKKEIETLEAEIQQIRRSREELAKSRETKNAELVRLQQQREELQSNLRQIEIELSVLQSDFEHAEELVSASGNAAEKFNDELQTIADDIERCNSMIEKYQIQIAESESVIEGLEKNIESMMQDSARYTSMIEDDNEAIVQCKVALSEQEAKILGMNEMIERVIDDISDLEDTYDTAKEQYDEYSRQRILLTTSGQESSEKEEQLQQERIALEERLASLNATLDQNRLVQEQSLAEQKQAAKQLAEVQDEKYKQEVKNARNETLLSSRKDKLWEEFEMSYAEALDMKDEAFAITAGNKEAREIRLRMAEIGDVSISSIEEYKKVGKRYEFMTAQETDLTKAMEELNQIIRNMDRTIRDKFKENFDKVVINFEKTFEELFGGGHAELRLEDESRPLESGIEIIAQPPGKKLKNINLMSGGEKTLTGIALMFAVLKAKPTPFCILDEVEAALDEANIERVSNYLKNFREIQFALITHQKATMEHADVLYGVTMPEQGISRLLSLKLDSNEGLDIV